MATKKQKLLHRARRLYARGLHRCEIADALGVTTETIRRWEHYDADHGRDWDEARRSRDRRRPALVIERLENAFAQLLSHRKRQEEAGKGKKRLEDRLLKLLRVIELYKKTRDDSQVYLDAMEDFVAYCVENVPPEDMEAIRSAVNRYIDHLKRENS